MYVYLDFLSATAGDLLIAGVLGQQLFFFVISLHTVISRKVVEKNVHAICSIHCSWHCSCRTYFCFFPLALANILSDLSCHSFKFLWRTVNLKPPTIPFGIVACTFSDNLSRNSCILSANVQFSSSFFGGLVCIAPTSRWCRSVTIPK